MARRWRLPAGEDGRLELYIADEIAMMMMMMVMMMVVVVMAMAKTVTLI